MHAYEKGLFNRALNMLYLIRVFINKFTLNCASKADHILIFVY